MPPARSESLKILLVEDNYADARLFQIALDDFDPPAEVTVVPDGEAAIALLSAHGVWGDPDRPDLVVTDLNMPRRDGHELMAHIKTSPALRSLPVVVFSGGKNPGEVERSYQGGAASYVSKPTGADAFFEVVHGLVRYWSRVVRSQRMIRQGIDRPAGETWAASAPLLTKSLDGTILSWSPLAEELYGYTADEVVGRSIATLVPPEAQGELRHLLDALARGESVQAFRAVRIHKDGHRLQVSLTVSPLRDREGQVIGGASEAREVH